ncbi:uncharacterized protein A4U43_C05F13910 [Asparagus officinalis]|uniref:Tyrosine-protein kinase catalytic domain-containing protein n=1 Tax=Asparagus officinalis TaxID=4686 RepID=A0A5P1EU17_ASPOF|nr:uncharacterized protein A4U43_C05F13910 [Asparagus officinalis]
MRSSQDFHPDYIMVAGSSRIGTTYHAVLRDGSALTVKRLYGCLLLEKQFRAEMGRMGHIRHPNLVPLLGYYVVEEEKLLIYKHMANGALSSMIRDGGQGLDWPTRLRIGVGEYEPRVTDFSLARLMKPWTSNEGLNTTPFLNGNLEEFGYIAPEYATNPVPSTKGDVYGFRVVLLELATRQKATEVSHDGSSLSSSLKSSSEPSKAARENAVSRRLRLLSRSVAFSRDPSTSPAIEPSSAAARLLCNSAGSPPFHNHSSKRSFIK